MNTSTNIILLLIIIILIQYNAILIQYILLIHDTNATLT